MGLGIVGSEQALYNLAVFVPHGAAILENGHGILGVVVQVAGSKDVFVLILQLHQRAAELGHIVVHHILEGFAGKLGLVLDDADVPHGIDDVGGHVPEGGVAQKIRVIVQEFGGAHHLAEVLPVFFYQLGALGAEQVYLIRPFGRILGPISQSRHCERQQQHKHQPLMRPARVHYLRVFQASRENSHSANIGSMTMYVSLIFLSRNSSTAAICLRILTLSRIWL